MALANSSVLNGWHPGETLMQQKLGYDQVPGLDQSWRYVYAIMTEQQRIFHTSNLHFLPVVTLDKLGRPWGSILASGDGEIGWVKSGAPGKSELEMKPKLWKGDPLWDTIDPFTEDESDRKAVLFAGIGVEVSTRRRNKMAGKIKAFKRDENGQVTLAAHVYESTGNCPKYITIHSVEPHPDTNPVLVYDKPDMGFLERLPSDIVDFIQSADTIWLGSYYQSSSPSHTSHLGVNHRGGRTGWVRIKPSDGRTLVVPDWSGNRFMSTLGNIEVTPVASVTIVDLKTGDVLYLTGDAKNLVGEEAERVMPRQKALTEVKVTGYKFVKDAVPVRQKEGTETKPSPYNPPVKLLREELEAQGTKVIERPAGGGLGPQAKLESVELHSPTIATFTFKSSIPLTIQPGQAMILDFKHVLGTPEYRHMAEDRPSLVNDDFIRTWTVSSYHPPALDSEGPSNAGPNTFSLTMKEKEGGIVTGALFRFAKRIEEEKIDPKKLDFRVGIVGVSGEFYLDTKASHDGVGTPRKLLWAAGGIGVTPFVTMLRALATSSERTWDIVFLLATREPEILIPLIQKAYGTVPPSLARVSLHVFTEKPVPEPTRDTGLEVIARHPRLGVEWIEAEKEMLQGREAYVCGPAGFENLVIDALVSEVGLEKNKVRKEGFAY
ncbi:oxidoreductase FAD/NAD(P)-binding protein [Coprinopsis sp. MPI-PUGE-AT-0042]|nr:oxidoreductase FAD/NAD(P)-binding protein [Coprinopsis sp. MPI-PUGE-AT-0042]